MNNNERENIEEKVTDFLLKKIKQYGVFNNESIKLTKDDLFSFVKHMESLDKLPEYQGDDEDTEYHNFDVITIDVKDTESSEKDIGLFTEIKGSLYTFLQEDYRFFLKIMVSGLEEEPQNDLFPRLLKILCPKVISVSGMIDLIQKYDYSEPGKKQEYKDKINLLFYLSGLNKQEYYKILEVSEDSDTGLDFMNIVGEFDEDLNNKIKDNLNFFKEKEIYELFFKYLSTVENKPLYVYDYLVFEKFILNQDSIYLDDRIKIEDTSKYVSIYQKEFLFLQKISNDKNAVLLRKLYDGKYQSYCLLEEECYFLLQDYKSNKNFYREFLKYQKGLDTILKEVKISNFSLLNLFRYLGIKEKEIEEIKVILESQKNEKSNLVKKITIKFLNFFK